MVIITAGMIGVGKSTLTEILARELGTKAFYEPVDENPILEKYYEDPGKYGFALQLYFLNKRFRLIKKAYRDKNNILDRSIYEDALFTKINVDKGTISQEEYDIYLDLLDNMMEELEGLPKKAPDLLVYLRADFDVILQHIKKRGRSYELPTEENGLLKYYSDLHQRYDKWFENYDYSPKMVVDLTEVDMTKSIGEARVLELVNAKLTEIGLIDGDSN